MSDCANHNIRRRNTGRAHAAIKLREQDDISLTRAHSALQSCKGKRSECPEYAASLSPHAPLPQITPDRAPLSLRLWVMQMAGAARRTALPAPLILILIIAYSLLVRQLASLSTPHGQAARLYSHSRLVTAVCVQRDCAAQVTEAEAAVAKHRPTHKPVAGVPSNANVETLLTHFVHRGSRFAASQCQR